jgi:hypothetical protein
MMEALYQTDVDALLQAIEDGATIDPNELLKAMMADYRNAETEQAAIELELLRLKERKESRAKRREWLRSQMLDVLRTHELKRFKDAVLGTATRKSCGPSVDVVDPGMIRGEWLKPQPPKLDKAGILAHYKETGEVVDGVEIVADKETVAIR